MADLKKEKKLQTALGITEVFICTSVSGRVLFFEQFIYNNSIALGGKSQSIKQNSMEF